MSQPSYDTGPALPLPGLPPAMPIPVQSLSYSMPNRPGRPGVLTAIGVLRIVVACITIVACLIIAAMAGNFMMLSRVGRAAAATRVAPPVVVVPQQAPATTAVAPEDREETADEPPMESSEETAEDVSQGPTTIAA